MSGFAMFGRVEATLRRVLPARSPKAARPNPVSHGEGLGRPRTRPENLSQALGKIDSTPEIWRVPNPLVLRSGAHRATRLEARSSARETPFETPPRITVRGSQAPQEEAGGAETRPENQPQAAGNIDSTPEIWRVPNPLVLRSGADRATRLEGRSSACETSFETPPRITVRGSQAPQDEAGGAETRPENQPQALGKIDSAPEILRVATPLVLRSGAHRATRLEGRSRIVSQGVV